MRNQAQRTLRSVSHGWRRGAGGDRTKEKRATDIKPVMTQIRVLAWTVVWALAVVGTEGFSLQPPPAGLTSVTAGRMPGSRWSAGTGARLGHAAGRSAFPFERRASFVRRAVGLQRRGSAAVTRASASTEPVSAGVAHQFDVQAAILCAGFAFEAYNEPSPTDARWERGADGCDVAFMSEAFARECYAGRVVVRLLEAEDLPPPVAKSGMAQALLTGADADAYVLFALNEESDNDKSLGTSGLPLFGGSNMFGLTNGAAAPKDGAIGLVRAVDRARSSTVWSNEGRRPRKGRVVWEGDERHALYVKDPARAQLAITVFDEEVSDVSGTCDPQPPSCCNVCLHSARGAGRQGWSHVCTRTPRSTRVGTRAWR